jgi:hypothetical protein
VDHEQQMFEALIQKFEYVMDEFFEFLNDQDGTHMNTRELMSIHILAG